MSDRPREPDPEETRATPQPGPDQPSPDETVPAALPSSAPPPLAPSPDETLPAPPPASTGGDETVAAPAPPSGSASDETVPAAPPAADETVAALPPGGGETRAVPPESASTTPEAAAPATMVGNYPIEAELGRGGMGLVYRAIDPRLKRPVALKVLTQDFGHDSEAYQRFEKEAQTLATIQHPNIATIYSLETHEGQPFFTMEWISGGTLAHRLEKGPIPLTDLYELARQVARGLEAAHARGIIHRDLKPANVMVTEAGEAKILDFGIAAAFGAAAGIAPSSLEEVSGTPAYMSPEQYRGAATDPRTDAWAFGVLLFECITKVSPFARPTFEECRTAVMEGTPDWSLLPADLPARLRDLLERTLVLDPEARLKDIADARRTLEELMVRGGVTERLAATSTPKPAGSKLPRSLTKFVGREKLRSAITEALEETPLVTLTGAGGCGKSRLALEAARELVEQFPGGTWLVELATVTEPDKALRAIAKALSVREVPGEDLEDTILRELADRKALLLLDNCEHLLPDIAELVETLLVSLPDLRVLASSREALALPGEEVIPVPPLSLPKERQRYSLADFEAFESVRLFTDRAGAVRRGFSLTERDIAPLTKIVRQLDGIPLAIELAAARVKVLPLDQIARRLDDRFKLLTGGSRTALRRQQTLRATIEWSTDLLEPEEQRLLRRLSVFSGGFTLEAVERVCASEEIEEWEILDRLTLLVDKSLVEFEVPDDDPDALPRYRLLETVREYGREQLENDEDVGEIRDRHLETYLRLAESAEDSHFRAQAWHRQIDEERANVRVALNHAQGSSANHERAFRIVRALGNHWLIRGDWHEGREAAQKTLELNAGEEETPLRAQVLGWATRFASSQGDFDAATETAREALAISERLSDAEGVAGAWNDLGVIARQRNEQDEAARSFEKSLEMRRAIGDQDGVAVALHNLALCNLKRLDLEAAEAALAESREIFRAQDDRQRVAVSLAVSGSVAYERGDFEVARGIYEEALEIAEELRDRRAQRSLLNNLGMIAEQRNDLESARRFHEESLLIREELGDRRGMWNAHLRLLSVATGSGDHAEAKRQGLAAIELIGDSAGDFDGLLDALIPLAIALGSLENARVWWLARSEAASEEAELKESLCRATGLEPAALAEGVTVGSRDELLNGMRAFLQS